MGFFVGPLDAEHNKNLSFDGYKILKKQLRTELSLNISIPSIDAFINEEQKTLLKSVHKGTIESIYIDSNYIKTPLIINVFYVKMSLPKTVEEVLNNDEFYKHGLCIQNEIKCISCTQNISCQNKLKNRKCSNYDCSNLSSILKKEKDFYSLSTYWVKSYSEWLNNKSKWRFLNYKFPHTTTIDQSFYRDQLSAFIGLGYLQTNELESILSSN